MATNRIPIINSSTLVDTSGTVFFEPSALNLNSNDRYGHFIASFTSQSLRQGFGGNFTIPKDYSTGAKLIILWATTATSGDCVWDFEYTAVADGETGDPSADQESVTVTDTAAGTARLVNGASINLTSANFTIDDQVLFNFYHDGADAADTLAATSYLYNVYFEYTTL